MIQIAPAAAKERQDRSSSKDEQGSFTTSAEPAEVGVPPKSHTSTEARDQVDSFTGMGHTTLWEAE